ncbi:MAG: exodeoxyribonuclease V subunit gamma [Fibrobacter sp.]|nr:exodeoxyribonuclease V subunit gamma [Fibrobacter sp.]
MLHLKFALNLEHLASEMMNEIKKHYWTSPFNAPVVIFPDPKLEQWFRLQWMKNFGTIAGFNSKMIDSFLMEILVADNEEKQKLNVETLRNVILAYLYQNKDNLLDIDQSGEVARYLKNENNQLDENRLFDFAGKMASLFLEYETSRPKDFKPNAIGSVDGILECWSEDGLRDFFTTYATTDVSNVQKSETWQRNLYSKVFHKQSGKDSLLTQVFKKNNEKRNEGKPIKKDITYLTLPFLFKKRTTFNCNKFLGTDGKPLPVFIFGLTGMGQFYRVIIQEFAKQLDINVFAYIQNPCMEFWEDIHSSRQKIRKWNRIAGRWSSNTDSECSEAITEISQKLSLDKYDEEHEDNVNASNENALLCYWGKTGRDNIKLWCAASDYDFEFDAQGAALPENPSLLQIVQHMVSTRSNSSEKLLEKFEETSDKNGAYGKDRSFSLTGAPTKIREMEHLHSRICKLLQEGAHISDILVVSPNLDDYRTAIYQAFDQNERGKDKDGKNNLHVPFSIVDSPAKNSLTENALNAIFGILERGSISRPDFFEIVRNPVVQTARHIDKSEIDAWENWIENLNVYRDREIFKTGSSEQTSFYKEDWKNGIRRMLLSYFTNVNVQFDNNNEALPYSDIDSANSKSLCKFVECINDLEKLLNFKRNNTGVSEDKLPDFIDLIGNFLAMQNPPDGFAGENIIYQNVIAAFDNLRCQYYAGTPTLTWECLRATLCGTAQSSSYSCGTLFVNGITFCKFISNRIIPVKHLFFFGADSKTFPGTKPSGMLDLRRAVAPWPGDDSPVAKLRYAFLCQFMSTSCGFHISYVNKDIVKDEDFYPSSVVNDIRSFLKNSILNTISDRGQDIEEWKQCGEHKKALKNIWPETKINLDENRPYEELFTERSFRNKELLNNNSPSNDTGKYSHDEVNESKAPPDRVSISQLKNFLADPFQFRISCMMQRDDITEDDVDPEDILFEPVDFNNLGHTMLVNRLVAESVSSDGKQEYADFSRELELKGLYPDGIFKDKLESSAKGKCERVLNQMKQEKDLEFSPSNGTKTWSYRKKLDEVFLKSGDKEFILTGTADFWDGGNNFVNVTSSTIKSKGKVSDGTKIYFYKESKFLANYVRALAHIANGENSEVQTVNLAIYSSDSSGSPSGRATVTATSVEARDTLSKIYDLAFRKKYSKCVPVDLLDEEFSGFNEFEEKLNDSHGPWAYFGKKHLFDKQRDLGYDPLHKDFVSFGQKDGENVVTGGEWYKAVSQQKELLKYLNVISVLDPNNKTQQDDSKSKASDGETKSKKGSAEKKTTIKTSTRSKKTVN